MKNFKPKFAFVVSAIFIAAFFRLIPHWPNFTPMATIALLGGALIRNRVLAFVIPLMAMFVSDVLTVQLINYRWVTLADYFSMPFTYINYLAFFVITAMGLAMRNQLSANGSDNAKRPTLAFASNLTLASLASAVVFFLISNFGAWTYNNLPKDLSGLLATYDLGIPFFGNMLLGNLVYNFLFFMGLMNLVARRWPEAQKVVIR